MFDLKHQATKNLGADFVEPQTAQVVDKRPSARDERAAKKYRLPARTGSDSPEKAGEVSLEKAGEESPEMIFDYQCKRYFYIDYSQ